MRVHHIKAGYQFEDEFGNVWVRSSQTRTSGLTTILCLLVKKGSRDHCDWPQVGDVSNMDQTTDAFPVGYRS